MGDLRASLARVLPRRTAAHRARGRRLHRRAPARAPLPPPLPATPAPPRSPRRPGNPTTPQLFANYHVTPSVVELMKLIGLRALSVLFFSSSSNLVIEGVVYS